MAKTISAIVRVRLVVEVTVGAWSDKESFAGLREQAIREATNTLNGMCHNSSVAVVGQSENNVVHVFLKES